jgi:ribosome-binding factor A
MEESKRQKQVAGLIQEEMSDIFQREGLNVIHGGMISISKVKVTPDLMEARIYLSFYQIPDQEKMLKHIREMDWTLRKQLAARIRNQVRKIPVLHYFPDDTLEYVFRMEEVFKNLHIPPTEEGKSTEAE